MSFLFRIFISVTIIFNSYVFATAGGTHSGNGIIYYTDFDNNIKYYEISNITMKHLLEIAYPGLKITVRPDNAEAFQFHIDKIVGDKVLASIRDKNRFNFDFEIDNQVDNLNPYDSVSARTNTPLDYDGTDIGSTIDEAVSTVPDEVVNSKANTVGDLPEEEGLGDSVKEFLGSEGFKAGMTGLGIVIDGMGMASVGIGMSANLIAQRKAYQKAVKDWQTNVRAYSSVMDKKVAGFIATSNASLGDSLRGLGSETNYDDGLGEQFSLAASTYPGLLNGILSSESSMAGKQLRDLDKRYQNFWARTEGLKNTNAQQKVLYTSGLVSLKAADSYAVSGDGLKARAHYKNSKLMMDILNGTADGITDSISDIFESYKGLAKLTYDILTNLDDPRKLGELLVDVILGIPEAASEMKKEFIEQFEVLKNGTAYERSRAISKISTDLLVGGIASRAKKVLKASKYYKRAQDTIRETTDKIKSLPATTREGISNRISKEFEHFKKIKESGNDLVSSVHNIKSLPNGSWQSPAGLVYGQDAIYGNRFNHVMAHTVESPRVYHTLFAEADPDSLSKILDKYWEKAQRINKFEQQGHRKTLVVFTDEVVGTKGERAIKYVIENESDVVTIFPVEK